MSTQEIRLDEARSNMCIHPNGVAAHELEVSLISIGTFLSCNCSSVHKYMLNNNNRSN